MGWRKYIVAVEAIVTHMYTHTHTHIHTHTNVHTHTHTTHTHTQHTHTCTHTLASFPGSPLTPMKNKRRGGELGTDSHVISRHYEERL